METVRGGGTAGEKKTMSDRDAFGLVLLLLGLEGEFDEELLQLLVTVVDAELLEAATHNNKQTNTTQGHKHVIGFPTNSHYFGG